MRRSIPFALFTAAAALLPVLAAEPPPASPIFDGVSLDGWRNVNCAPATFFVKDGEIVTTGKPTGFLRTEKQYENFVLELEWMHENVTDPGNSGIFVWGDPVPAVGTGYTRGIEVQVLVNYKSDWATNHGDIFSIWGAKCAPDRPHPTRPGLERCLPSEDRCKGGGEWNRYKLVADDGSLKLHVNGKEVSGVSNCVPRKGYLALESEGAVCRFRNLTLRELPSTSPAPAETAELDRGHRSLFDGLTLDGFDQAGEDWRAGDGVLRCAGKSPLGRDFAFPVAELLFDWKRPADQPQEYWLKIGDDRVEKLKPAAGAKPGAWNRGVVAGPITGRVEWSGAKGVEVRNVFARAGE